MKLAFEFPDKMKQPIQCGELCYVLPHQNVSFCFLFTNEDDAFVFSIGVRVLRGDDA